MANDLNFREGAYGPSAKIVATLSFTNGRTNLDDVTSVEFVFESKASGTVRALAGAVEDSAAMKVSLEFAADDWTAMANEDAHRLTINLLTTDSSRIPIPEGSKGFDVKFHPHPAVT